MQIVKTSRLKPGMVTAAPVTIRHGLPVVKECITLTNSLISRIAFYEIKEVKIEDQINSAETFGSAPSTPTYSRRIASSSLFQRFKTDYAKSVIDLKNALSAVLASQNPPDAGTFYQILQPLLSDAPTSLQMFGFLHAMPETGDSVYAHSLNVALISDMLGKWLSLPQEELEILAAASLLHDIGKLKIPAEILDKPEKYTPEEFELVKKHPVFGYELLSFYEQIDPRIPKAALFHHERCDGTGYPQGLKMNEMKESDHFAQIIAIADVYDAMTAKRAHRAALCPFHVIADFEIEGLQKYNPKYILTFLERIAYTYQSNRVMLTDGRYAKILMLNRQFLSRPIVEVEDGIVDLSKTPDIRIQTLL